MTQNKEDGVTTATPEKNKTYSMAELRRTKRSLFVRNDTGGLWTLHDKMGSGGRIDLELGPNGTKTSISYLPPDALDVPGIARNLANGKITVSPDLEEEMIERMSGGSSTSQGLLSQFQIKVEDSPQARAISVQDKVAEIATAGRGGIVPQGAQGRASIDEFNNPQPFKTEEGRWFDPVKAVFIDAPGSGIAPVMTEGDIKSVTITRPKSLPEDH